MKILDVVFDFGGAVFDWNPAAMVRAHFGDDLQGFDSPESLARAIFSHSDWHAFDRGERALDEVIAQTAQRLEIAHTQMHALIAPIGAKLQPIATTVTARNAAGNVTVNFNGTATTTPGFAQAVTLVDASGVRLRLVAPRIHSVNLHGTGCTFASIAAAASVAFGKNEGFGIGRWLKRFSIGRRIRRMRVSSSIHGRKNHSTAPSRPPSRLPVRK